MLPFSYSRWAICIVCEADMPSLRPASCCSVVVRNGAYGLRVYGLESIDRTENCESRSAPASAVAVSSFKWTVFAPFSSPIELKSRPCATRLLSTETRREGNCRGVRLSPASSVASRSQYDALRKAIRSRSRSTTIRIATDCTRPADSFGMTFFHSTGETS